MGQENPSNLKNSGYVMEKKNKYFLDIDRKFIYHNLQARNTMIEKINAMIWSNYNEMSMNYIMIKSGTF